MKEDNTTSERRSPIDSMIQNIKLGDRVIWIVVVVLMMFSLVAIFSSTSLLAIQEKISRTTIFFGQLKIVGLGVVILVLASAIPNIKFFRRISRWGFIFSLLLLTILDLHLNIGGFIRVKCINGAYRSIQFGGFSVQVFEVVKVAMVMYLAWAVQTYENGRFVLANNLAREYPKYLGWMNEPKAQLWIFVFLPMLLTVVMILPGSTGSALLCGIVMFATIMIGGIKFKDLLRPLTIGIVGLGLCVGIHLLSGGKFVPRLATAISRLDGDEKKINADSLKVGSTEFYDYLDKIRQPEAAEIAIVEGGRKVFGKGPGKSTQKYVVAVMFEDYMFSLIIEEYGLIVGFLVILMYMSLFARGTLIVHNCNNRYAKCCVGGLVFLITFQALFHVLVNCNIGILTGQTLPLVSHGRCSFLCFCVAFGVILSISKMANSKIHQQMLQEQKNIEENESNN